MIDVLVCKYSFFSVCQKLYVYIYNVYMVILLTGHYRDNHGVKSELNQS